MSGNRLIISRKRNLASVATRPRFLNKAVDQMIVEKQVVSMDEQLLAIPGDLSQRVHFQCTTAMVSQQVALKQPERLVENTQIARRLAEGGDECTISNDDALHSLRLPFLSAGGR